VHTIILTGASKGLGRALAARLMGAGTRLVCLSRERSESAVAQAAQTGTELIWHAIDLADLDRLQAELPAIFAPERLRGSDRLWLINNAGILAPVKPMGALDPDALRRNVAVNLTAPILLANAFLAATRELEAQRVIVNVSSGAAKHPIEGWGAYCTTKAGLHMATRAMALEQARQSRPARILSYAPGVLDTGLQEEVRASAVADFPALDRFIALKAEGKLATAEAVAETLVRFLQEDTFENGALVDFRDLVRA
jgi:benzil reductase ((S)-benzoin forming)